MKIRLLELSATVLALLLMVGVGCSSAIEFEGTSLDPPEPAPDFVLQDQFGDVVSLSDFKGSVVILTFLYTSCPDVCPLTTEALRRAYAELGPEAQGVELLAVSVDPKRDTVEAANAYSKERDMLDKWRFLVGTEEELAPVWVDYYVGPVQAPSNGSEGHHSAGIETAIASTPGVKGFQDDVRERYNVSHQAPVYLIDQKGRRRAVITSLLLDPSPLLHDIRLLLD